MNNFQQYMPAQTLDQAFELLAGSSDSVAVVAGGTDLLLELRQGRHAKVDRLVDVSGIESLHGISSGEGKITIGAAVTHKQILDSPLLQEHARCVVEGCGLIGGPQVRNVATLGGNVAHALPAGDGTVSLLALNTEVELATAGGASWQPLMEIFAGPGKVTFDRSSTILTRFRFEARGEREGSAFRRVMRPQGVAIAILNMAAWVRLEGTGDLEAVRIACGPAGPKPFRAYQTEKFLAGRSWDPASCRKAAEILSDEVNLRTSAHRATKEYRYHLLPLLLEKVLDSAVQRAGQ